MINDIRGLEMTARSAEAAAAYDEAVEAFVAHDRDMAEALATTLRHDPSLLLAHILHGFAMLLLARRETVAEAQEDWRAACESFAERGGTARESALLDALGAWATGAFEEAEARLDSICARWPHDLLAQKTLHAMRFMGGDPTGMHAATERALNHWDDTVPGYGYLLGMHTFGLEETGAFDAAIAAGTVALAHAPHDAWGMHAVAHVHEMRGDTKRGLVWLEAHRDWSAARCNNFRFHLAWHECLFRLEAPVPDMDAVLALYDERVRPLPTDDYRDVANAVSLLRRLEQRGVPVGDRWAELAAIARGRSDDLTLVFASLHYLLALIGAGRDEEARRLADRLADPAGRTTAHQAAVCTAVGADLAAALCAAAAGRTGPLRRMRGRCAALLRLGGSHAQRDLFLRLLLEAASRDGDRALFVEAFAERRRLKADDHFARMLIERLGERLEQAEPLALGA